MTRTDTRQSLALNGVHHTARPTWKLRETVQFYKEIMGLKLVHCVSARGWGKLDHPDFLHFFFDSGAGSTIAFFYYLGHSQPDHLMHRPEFDNDAIHTSWRVESRDELMAWRARLEKKGVEIMYQIEHEVVESIYFRDPNGYYLEIGHPTRAFCETDTRDAELTLRAAMLAEQEAAIRDEAVTKIEPIWQVKGRLVAEMFGKVA